MKKAKIWGLGIGDWGLGIGDWAQSPIPHPQTPNPQPQSPNKTKTFNKVFYQYKHKKINLK